MQMSKFSNMASNQASISPKAIVTSSSIGKVLNCVNGIYYCGLCLGQFELESIFKTHLETHSFDCLYRCFMCPALAPDTSSITDHIEKKHPNNDKYYGCLVFPTPDQIIQALNMKKGKTKPQGLLEGNKSSVPLLPSKATIPQPPLIGQASPSATKLASTIGKQPSESPVSSLAATTENERQSPKPTRESQSITTDGKQQSNESPCTTFGPASSNMIKIRNMISALAETEKRNQKETNDISPKEKELDASGASVDSSKQFSDEQNESQKTSSEKESNREVSQQEQNLEGKVDKVASAEQEGKIGGKAAQENKGDEEGKQVEYCAIELSDDSDIEITGESQIGPRKRVSASISQPENFQTKVQCGYVRGQYVCKSCRLGSKSQKRFAQHIYGHLHTKKDGVHSCPYCPQEATPSELPPKCTLVLQLLGILEKQKAAQEAAANTGATPVFLNLKERAAPLAQPSSQSQASLTSAINPTSVASSAQASTQSQARLTTVVNPAFVTTLSNPLGNLVVSSPTTQAVPTMSSSLPMLRTVFSAETAPSPPNTTSVPMCHKNLPPVLSQPVPNSSNSAVNSVSSAASIQSSAGSNASPGSLSFSRSIVQSVSGTPRPSDTSVQQIQKEQNITPIVIQPIVIAPSDSGSVENQTVLSQCDQSRSSQTLASVEASAASSIVSTQPASSIVSTQPRVVQARLPQSTQQSETPLSQRGTSVVAASENITADITPPANSNIPAKSTNNGKKNMSGESVPFKPQQEDLKVEVKQEDSNPQGRAIVRCYHEGDQFVCERCKYSVHETKAKVFRKHLWFEVHPTRTCSHCPESSQYNRFKSCPIINQLMMYLLDAKAKKDKKQQEEESKKLQMSSETTEKASAPSENAEGAALNTSPQLVDNLKSPGKSSNATEGSSSHIAPPQNPSLEAPQNIENEVSSLHVDGQEKSPISSQQEPLAHGTAISSQTEQSFTDVLNMIKGLSNSSPSEPLNKQSTALYHTSKASTCSDTVGQVTAKGGSVSSKSAASVNTEGASSTSGLSIPTNARPIFKMRNILDKVIGDVYYPSQPGNTAKGNDSAVSTRNVNVAPETTSQPEHRNSGLHESNASNLGTQTLNTHSTEKHTISSVTSQPSTANEDNLPAICITNVVSQATPDSSTSGVNINSGGKEQSTELAGVPLVPGDNHQESGIDLCFSSVVSEAAVDQNYDNRALPASAGEKNQSTVRNLDQNPPVPFMTDTSAKSADICESNTSAREGHLPEQDNMSNEIDIENVEDVNIQRENLEEDGRTAGKVTPVKAGPKEGRPWVFSKGSKKNKAETSTVSSESQKPTGKAYVCAFFKCSSWVAQDAGSLKIHNMLHHPQVKRLPCSFCAKSFSSEEDLISHTDATHIGSKMVIYFKSYQCGFKDCWLACDKAVDFLSHNHECHANSASFPCCFCKQEFRTLAELVLHIDESVTYSCAVCTGVLRSTYPDIRKHVLTSIHGSKQFLSTGEVDSVIKLYLTCILSNETGEIKYKAINRFVHVMRPSENASGQQETFRCTNCSLVTANEAAFELHVTQCKGKQKENLSLLMSARPQVIQRFSTDKNTSGSNLADHTTTNDNSFNEIAKVHQICAGNENVQHFGPTQQGKGKGDIEITGNSSENKTAPNEPKAIQNRQTSKRSDEIEFIGRYQRDSSTPSKPAETRQDKLDHKTINIGSVDQDDDESTRDSFANNDDCNDNGNSQPHPKTSDLPSSTPPPKSSRKGVLQSLGKGSLVACDKCSFGTEFRVVKAIHERLHLHSQDRSKMLWCPICSFSTNILLHFKIHMQCHTEKPRVRLYNCGYCSFSSNKMDLVEDHHESLHEDLELKSDVKRLTLDDLQCPHCSILMKNESELLEHFEKEHGHHSIRKYLKDMYNIASLQVIGDEGEEEQNRTRITESDDSKKDSENGDGNKRLAEEMQLNLDRFQCPSCDYTNHIFRLWLGHVHKKHKEVCKDYVVYSCGCCSWKSTSHDKIILHCKTRHPGNKVMVQTMQLADVAETVEETQEESGQSNTNAVSVHHCEFCNFSTNSKADLAEHWVTHEVQTSPSKESNQEEPENTEIEDDEKGEARYDKDTLRLIDDVILNLRYDKASLAKDLTCPLCPLSTTNRAAMLKHIIFHKNQAYLKSGFKCGYCMYMSKVESIITRHLNVYHSNQPAKKEAFGIPSDGLGKHPKFTPNSQENNSESQQDMQDQGLGIKAESLSAVSVKPEPSETSSVDYERNTMTPSEADAVEGDPNNEFDDDILRLIEDTILNLKYSKKEDDAVVISCPVCPYEHKERSSLIRHMMNHQNQASIKDGYRCAHCLYTHVNPTFLKKHSTGLHPGLPCQYSIIGNPKPIKSPTTKKKRRKKSILGVKPKKRYKYYQRPETPFSGGTSESESVPGFTISAVVGSDGSTAVVNGSVQQNTEHTMTAEDYLRNETGESQKPSQPVGVDPETEEFCRSIYSTKSKEGNVYHCKNCIFVDEDPAKVYSHFCSSHPDQCPFQCGYCDYRSVAVIKIQQHCDISHADLPVKVSPVIVTNESNQRNILEENDGFSTYIVPGAANAYRCSVCGYEEGSRVYLKQHLLDSHMKYFPYKCRHCDFASAEVHIVQKHTAEIHTTQEGEKISRNNKQRSPVQASDGAASNSEFLNIKVKTEQTSSAVSDTGNTDFTDSESLSNASLHGENQQVKHDKQCGMCNYSTKWPSDLKNHVVSRHLQLYLFNCSFCDFGCRLKTKLAEHYEVKHKGMGGDVAKDFEAIASAISVENIGNISVCKVNKNGPGIRKKYEAAHLRIKNGHWNKRKDNSLQMPAETTSNTTPPPYTNTISGTSSCNVSVASITGTFIPQTSAEQTELDKGLSHSTLPSDIGGQSINVQGLFPFPKIANPFEQSQVMTIPHSYQAQHGLTGFSSSYPIHYPQSSLPSDIPRAPITIQPIPLGVPESRPRFLESNTLGQIQMFNVPNPHNILSGPATLHEILREKSMTATVGTPQGQSEVNVPNEVNDVSAHASNPHNIDTSEKCHTIFECLLCNQQYSNRYGGQIHLISHFDMDPFICSSCSFSSKIRKRVEEHILKDHPNETVSIYPAHREHPQAHKQLKAKKVDLEEYNEIKRLSNLRKLKQKQGPKISGQIQCSLCNVLCNNKALLSGHMVMDHEDFAGAMCCYCNMYMEKSNQTLKHHFSTVHPLKEPKYRLVKGGVAYGKPINTGAMPTLSIHARSKKVGFANIVRGRLSAYQSHSSSDKTNKLKSLRSYFKASGATVELACNHCDYTTMLHKYMKVHVKAHLGFKPYQCSHCSFQSTSVKTVENHSQNMHIGLSHEVQKVSNPEMEASLPDHYTFKVKYGDQALNPDNTEDGHLPSFDQSHLNVWSAKANTEDIGWKSSADGRGNNCQPNNESPLDSMQSILEKQHPAEGEPCSSGKRATGDEEKEVFICVLCGKDQPCRDSLLEHLMWELDFKQWACPHCKYKDVTLLAVKRHCFKVHPRQPFRVMFEKDEVRMLRIQALAERSRVSVKSCNPVQTETASSGLSDSRNLPSGQEDRWYNCPLCTYKTQNKGHMQQHSLQHGPRRFKCGYCDVTKVYRCEVKKHHAGNHPEEPFVAIPLLEGQESPSGKASAPQTIEPIENASRVESAVINSSKSPRKPGLRIKLKLFKCRHCIYKTAKKCNLQQHELRHGPKRFMCGYCSFTGIYRAEVRKHHCHKHLGKQADIIDLCPKKNSNEEIVAKGAQEGEQPSKGTLADSACAETEETPLSSLRTDQEQAPVTDDQGVKKIQVFVEETTLKIGSDEHRSMEAVGKWTSLKRKATESADNSASDNTASTDTQQNDELFTCPHCDYTTLLKRNMIQHSFVHTAKPFGCGHCSFTAIYRADVKRHHKKHPDQPMIITKMSLDNSSKEGHGQVPSETQTKPQRVPLQLSVDPKAEGGLLAQLEAELEDLSEASEGSSSDSEPEEPAVEKSQNVTAGSDIESTEKDVSKKGEVIGVHDGMTITDAHLAFDSGQYRCSMCDYKSRDRERSVGHYARNHMPLRWECGYCTYKKVITYEMKAHIKLKHPGLPINYVRLVPKKDNSELLNHRKKAEKRPASFSKPGPACSKKPKLNMSNVPSVFCCFLCTFKTNNTLELIKHQRKHAEEERVTKPPPERSSPTNSGSNSSSHVEESEGEKDEETSVKCKHCFYVAKNENDLQDHNQEKHLFRRPFKCGYCDFSSFTKGHVRSHSLRQHACKELSILRQDEIAEVDIGNSPTRAGRTSPGRANKGATPSLESIEMTKTAVLRLDNILEIPQTDLEKILKKNYLKSFQS